MANVFPAGIRYTSHVSFEDDFDAYFVKIEGELLCDADDESDTEIVAGRIEAYYIDVIGAESHGFSTLDLFDQLQEASDCYQLLYDEETGELAESFLNVFEDSESCNILLLQRLEVLPAFRGSKLGLAAISRTIQQFGRNCGYVVLKPLPLQVEPVHNAEKQRWRANMELDQFTTDIESGRRRLCDYYSLLGFRPIPNSEWMALNLDFMRPSLGRLGLNTRNQLLQPKQGYQ